MPPTAGTKTPRSELARNAKRSANPAITALPITQPRLTLSSDSRTLIQRARPRGESATLATSRTRR